MTDADDHHVITITDDDESEAEGEKAGASAAAPRDAAGGSAVVQLNAELEDVESELTDVSQLTCCRGGAHGRLQLRELDS
jgi:hypothetical protein